MATTTRLKKLNARHKQQVEALHKDGYIETTKERGNRKYWLKAYKCGIITGAIYKNGNLLTNKSRYYDTERKLLLCYNTTKELLDKYFLNKQ